MASVSFPFTNTRVYFGIFLSVIVSVLFSFFFLSTDTYALTDLVQTFTSSSPSLSVGDQVYGSLISTAEQYQSYPYLIVEIIPSRSVSTSGSNYLYSGFGFRMDCMTGFSVPYSGKVIYFLSHNQATCRGSVTPTTTSAWDFSSRLTSDETLVFTLTDTLPSNCPSSPSGTISITENGTYDVSSYASAEVDIPPVMGDYHDDLVRGINAIYVLSGTLLVIYFFYCIYRMIIKNVGESK